MVRVGTGKRDFGSLSGGGSDPRRPWPPRSSSNSKQDLLFKLNTYLRVLRDMPFSGKTLVAEAFLLSAAGENDV